MTFEKHPKSDNLDFLCLCFLATSCLSYTLTKYVFFLIPRSYTLFMWNSCFLLNHSKLCSCSACKTACKMKTITTGKVKVNFKAKMASLASDIYLQRKRQHYVRFGKRQIVLVADVQKAVHGCEFGLDFGLEVFGHRLALQVRHQQVNRRPELLHEHHLHVFGNKLWKLPLLSDAAGNRMNTVTFRYPYSWFNLTISQKRITQKLTINIMGERGIVVYLILIYIIIYSCNMIDASTILICIELLLVT